MATQQRHSSQVKIGFEDGIEVIGDHATEQYMIDTPNNFEVYYMLLKNNGQEFCTREESHDPARASFSLKINSTADIKALNEKVAMCRTIAREIDTERQDFQDVLAFDLATGGRQVAFMYRAPDAKHPFSIGEVVRTGKYFVAQHCGSNDEKTFVRIINSNRFLHGDEFKDREAVLKEKFPDGNPDLSPDAARKKFYFAWGSDGKIEVRDYKPRQTAEQTPREQGQPTEAQKAALFAYVQANGITWKSKLNEAWMSGNYKATPKDHQGLLQQVRNQLGPEWLRTAVVRDLAPGPTEASPQAQAALKRSGQVINSIMEAECRWGDGERIFAFHEQGGKPLELTRIDQLKNWTPDQLLALPVPQQRQAKEDAQAKAPEAPTADATKAEEPAASTEGQKGAKPVKAAKKAPAKVAAI